MKDCMSSGHHDLFKRIAIPSLVLSLGCLAGGCGTGSVPEAESKKRSSYASNLKEQMKQQAAQAKAAAGKKPAGRR